MSEAPVYDIPASKEDARLIAEINARGKEVGIVCKRVVEVDEEHSAYQEYISVEMPEGGVRNRRIVPLPDIEELKQFLSIDFTKYRFIEGFEAVWCPSEGTIEAKFYNLTAASNYFRQDDTIYRRLFKNYKPSFASAEPFDASKYNFVIQEYEPSSRIGVEISPISKEKEVLDASRIESFAIIPLTLKIKGVNAKTDEQAKTTLKDVAGSLFFQIDLTINLPLRLTSYRELRWRYKPEITPNALEGAQYLKSRYEEQPLTLYWYARNAHTSPLIQFLAYYQVVEFYFPIFSQEAAAKAAREIISDPRFRPQSNRDIRKLLGAIQPLRKGGGFGAEPEQLSSVLKGCVNVQDLFDYLKSDSEVVDFFNGKSERGEEAKASEFHVRLNTKQQSAPDNFISDVAKRIYDIRCKIVHSKEGGLDGSGEMILPFSDAAEHLEHDVALMKYIAQKVLVVCSEPLSTQVV